MKDYVFWHDRTTREALDFFEDKWSNDDQLTYANAKQCMIDKGLDVEVDSARHMIVSAFKEGEARVLLENAELTNTRQPHDAQERIGVVATPEVPVRPHYIVQRPHGVGGHQSHAGGQGHA